MATVILVGAVQNTADSVNGWASGNADGELFYQGSGSVGAKVSGLVAFVHTGAVRNFSIGGGNEGDHIIVILNSLTPGKLDTKANGGIRIRCGSSTTDYGDWYVDGIDTKPATAAFLPYIIDPSSDFDAVAGGLTTTGNPAQLSAADVFGGAFNATSGIMGNFNNALVDQITVGKGLRVTGSNGLLQDFVDADEGTTENRYGWITTKDTVVYCQGKLYFGSSVSSVVFNDANQVLVFQDVNVSDTHFEILSENASNNVTFDRWVIKSAGVKKVTFTLNTGTWVIKNGLIVGAFRVDLGANVTIESQVINDTGEIVQNGGTITGSTISNQTSPLIANDITKITGTTFNSLGTGHAIEISEGIGNINLDDLTFNGYGADDTADAAINYTGTTPIEISPIGGGGLTVNPTSLVTVLQSQQILTLNNLKNPTKVYLVNTDLPETDPNYILDNQLITGGVYTYTFSQGSAINALYRLINLQYKTIEQDVFLNSVDLTIPVSQQIDREYENN